MHKFRNRLLDCRCPINWSHPINRGLVGEWTAVPLSGWRGANKLRDLVRGGRNPHDGTLNGTVTWLGPIRPSNYGVTKYDGSTGYVSAGTAVTAPPLTLAIWVNTTDTGNPRTAISIGKNGATDSWCRVYANSGASCWSLNTGDSGGTQQTLNGGSLVANKWHQFIVSMPANGNATFYMDGTLIGVIGSSVSFNAFTGISLGVLQYSSNIQFWQGYLDGGMLYNRALTLTEVESLYEQSQRGNPGRWNWLRKSTWLLPPAAGATAQVWPYQDTELCGGCSSLGMGV